MRWASQSQGRELSKGGAAEGTGGREEELKQRLRAERENHLLWKGGTTQTGSSLTAQTLFIVGGRPPKSLFLNLEMDIIGIEMKRAIQTN